MKSSLLLIFDYSGFFDFRILVLPYVIEYDVVYFVSKPFWCVKHAAYIKVSLDIAKVLTISTLLYIDMSRDDQMFSIFLSLANFSKKFLLVEA